jgi:heme A synthase
LSHLRIFSLAAAASVYVLMVIGAYVSSIGAGMACGRDWPLCEGRILPRPDPLVLAEYTHRVFTLLVTFFVLGTAVMAFRDRRSNGRVVAPATLASILLITQILVGMLVVAAEIDPLLRTLHLALATALFGASLITAVLAHSPQQS